MRAMTRIAGTTLALSMMCGAALASVQQFTFEGSVYFAPGSAFNTPEGTQVTGSFSYDAGTASTYNMTSGAEYRYSDQGLPNSQLSLNIGGHVVTGPLTSILVNAGGNPYGDNAVALTANMFLTVDGAPSSGGYLTLSLFAPTGSPDKFALPTSFKDAATPSERPSGAVAVSVGGNASGNAAFFVTSISAVSSVPEASTCALFVAGLAGLGYAVRRGHKEPAH